MSLPVEKNRIITKMLLDAWKRRHVRRFGEFTSVGNTGWIFISLPTINDTLSGDNISAEICALQVEFEIRVHGAKYWAKNFIEIDQSCLFLKKHFFLSSGETFSKSFAAGFAEKKNLQCKQRKKKAWNKIDCIESSLVCLFRFFFVFVV